MLIDALVGSCHCVLQTERSETLDYPPLEEILRTRPEMDYLDEGAASRVPKDSLLDKDKSNGSRSEQPTERTYTHHLYHHFDRDSAGTDVLSRPAPDGTQ